MSGFQGFEVNSHRNDGLVFAIGKYLVNFGAVEYLTYILIEELSHDEIVYELSIDMPLSKRLKLIKDLAVKRKLNEKLLKEIKKIVKVSEELANFRNSIAHNPIMIVEKDNNSAEASALVGVPNMKKAKTKINVPVVSLGKINAGVDATVELVKNMKETFDAIKQQNNA